MTSTMRYRYRAYLKPNQVEPVNQVFGCTRVVYNDALALCKAEYEAGRAKPSFAELSRQLTQSKKTEGRAWLAEVSSVPLQQSLRDFERAYKNFFDVVTGKRKKPRGVKKVGSPRFKSRHNRQAARFMRTAFKITRVTPKKGFVELAKIGEIEFRLSRPLPSEPSSVTLIGEPDGRHYVSFVVEVEPEEAPAPKAEAVGIDLGLEHLAITVDTNGVVARYENPRWLRNKERKLANLQRDLSRKKRGSKRYAKQLQRIAVAHRKVRETRTHHHHQVANKVVGENQTIALETLNISGLKQTRMGKSISDAGWGQLVSLIQEKAKRRGRQVITADQFAPTTQTCSVCGTNGGKKALRIRAWTCASCGTCLDRDANAAVNIMLAAGLAESLNERGGRVRQALVSVVAVEALTRLEPAPSRG